MLRRRNLRSRVSRQIPSRPRTLRKRKQIHGHILTVPPHPPDFVSRPWYNLVVRIESPPAVLNTQVISTAIESQLGISSGLLNIRLQTVRVWGALVAPDAGSPLQPVVLVVFDPFRGVQSVVTADQSRVLEQITDYPDMVNRASVGFKYSEAQSELSLYANPGGSAQPLFQLSGAGPNSIMYINLLWRAGVISPTLFDVDTQSEDSEVEIISRRVRSDLSLRPRR
jgi:hypothetical protein